MSAPRPSVFDTCLQGLSKKSPQEMHSTQQTLRTVMHTIYSMLHTVSMNFLKGQVRILAAACLSSFFTAWDSSCSAEAYLCLPYVEFPRMLCCLCADNVYNM